MSDHQTTINEWAQYASSFRKLKAYGLSADGSRQPLDGEAIVIALDEERSLLVALSERMDGEGVANLVYVSPEQPAQGESGR